MYNIRSIPVLAVFVPLFLVGCAKKTDANETNFTAALEQYLDKKGDLCLYLDRWPVDVPESETRASKSLPFTPATQMAALESVGLVKGEGIEVESPWALGPSGRGKVRVKRYTLSDAAKPFVRESNAESIGLGGKTGVKRSDLCWGKKAVAKVVKWEGPMALGEYQEARVTYKYKVTNLAHWANSAEVQSAFPAIKDVLGAAEVREMKHAVKLTSVGWEAKGLD